MRPTVFAISLLLLAGCQGQQSSDSVIVRDTGGVIYELANGVCLRTTTQEVEDHTSIVPVSDCRVE
ncbi:MAG: hypothetical protein AAGJ28_09185 [Pseudomonadota bacterium]